MQPQTKEQRGKRACASTARGSFSKAMKGLVDGAAQGSAEFRKNWTTASSTRSSGFGTHPSSAEFAQAARAAWRGGRYKAVRGAMREQGRRKTGTASLPHAKLARMSAPGPTGERQEHLDAVISFVGAEQRRRIFRVLDILKVKWATWDLPEVCRFPLNTQLMFLKKE